MHLLISTITEKTAKLRNKKKFNIFDKAGKYGIYPDRVESMITALIHVVRKYEIASNYRSPAEWTEGRSGSLHSTLRTSNVVIVSAVRHCRQFPL